MQKKDKDFCKQKSLFELSFSIASIDRERSIKFLFKALNIDSDIKIDYDYNKLKTLLLKEKIETSDLNEENTTLNFIVTFWRICHKIPLLKLLQLLQISRNYSKTRKEIIQNLPKAVKLLIEELGTSDEFKPLSQITRRIREEHENWPQPDFPRPKDCVTYTNKLGLVYIRIRGDYYVTLVPRYGKFFE